MIISTYHKNVIIDLLNFFRMYQDRIFETKNILSAFNAFNLYDTSVIGISMSVMLRNCTQLYNNMNFIIKKGCRYILWNK